MACQSPNCGFMPPSVRWIYAEPLRLATKRAWSRISGSAWPVAATRADNLLCHVFASELSGIFGLSVPFPRLESVNLAPLSWFLDRLPPDAAARRQAIA